MHIPLPLVKAATPAANVALRAWSHLYLRKYDPENTILLFSAPRGGSTWLAELVGSMQGYPILWEPLHRLNAPTAREHGIQWHDYVPSGTPAPQKHAYIRQVISGSNISTETTSSLTLRPSQLLRFRGFLVKFVNGNTLLPWIMHEFPLRGLLLLRHPCAVVSSQLRHGAFQHVVKKSPEPPYPEALQSDYPVLPRIYSRIETHEELLALHWAAYTLVPLSQPPPHSWHLTTYESLVESGTAEIENIFEYLQEELPASAKDQLRTPSATATNSSHIAKGKNRLTGWKRHLKPEQVRRILSVAHEAGLDFYTEDLMPDFTKLNQLCQAP